MANKTDKLVVSDIHKTLYVIPYYQRGYRWTGRNVKQLLTDLFLFTHEGNNNDSEYCLQPVVLQEIPKDAYTDILKNEESVVRVVDGQQRLTTISIILWKLKLYPKPTWDIYYDSEKKRLSDILNGEFMLNSINDYFRKEVSDAVDEWFAEYNSKYKDPYVKDVLTGLFLSKGKRIAFLKYDIDTQNSGELDHEGHEAFRRLNDGKTPLTSSELIRALYMVQSSGLSVQQQMEISKEWEIIENSLRDNQFWLMFNTHGLEDTPTRIDLLFALVLGVNLRDAKANPRIVFDKLEDDKELNLEMVWNKVLHTFWWMQSCYSDIELCNFLCWIRAFTDISASTIYNYWHLYPVHKEFKNCVIKIIQETKFSGVNLQSLDSVDYSWDKGELRKLFVLLNVLDCNKSKERFRFDLFNDTKGWDIEHIDSQTPNDFKQDKNKKEWLSSAWNELSKDKRCLFIQKFFPNERFDSFDINGIELDQFESYAEYIVQLMRNSDDALPDDKANRLGNLALLNLSINRSYKNDIFPLKRKAIIKHVNDGKTFIPPCTVKAFTKFYTKSASKITSWQNTDYEGYYEVMNERFTTFMNYEVILNKNAKESRIKNIENRIDDIIVPQQISESNTPNKNDGNNRFTVPIEFPAFMERYNVTIPKIQRLYVQGRTDKLGKKCLSGFASCLVKSVSECSPLLLDFVYGIDASGISKPEFYPLDGQQRLTTLLLLSWLCGLSKPEWLFRYESRRSTEVFIKGLLSSNPPHLDKPSNYEELKQKAKMNGKEYPSLCKDYICSFPWFHQSWLCDTGISGMMEMLDSLYDKLLNVPSKQTFSMNSIEFLVNYLDVSKKSYDHIFLKMNSRGRELTEWDNMNAVLDECLPASFRRRWQEKVQLWYELMWKKMPSIGSKDTEKISRVDAQMMSIVELAIGCACNEKYTNTYDLSLWLQSKENIKSVEYFYDICYTIFSALEIDENKNLHYLIPNWSLSGCPRIPDFACKENEVVRKFYQPILAYYASKKSLDEQWMRVIWNLVENIGVDGTSFKQAIHLIDELAQGKDNILDYLSHIRIDEIKSRYKNAENQLQEEIDKATQIVKNTENIRPNDWDETKLGKWSNWNDAIVAAESKRYFAGAVRFLFHDGQDHVKWSTFCTKWLHANSYFDNNGIKDDCAAELVSALLKRCALWRQIHDQFIFNRADWKLRVLLNPLYAAPLDFVLESPTLDVKAVEFEEGLVCERIIRDRLCEDKFIRIITSSSEYKSYRVSDNRYFYGWRKHDGILFDWRTDNEIPESWERRRNVQIQSMLAASNDLIVNNKHITGEIYYGYNICFVYNKIAFEWSDENQIYIREDNQRKPFAKITPDMNGAMILGKLQQKINEKFCRV